MRNLAQWLDEYSASHRNPTNKLLHWICVPLIAFSIACALKVIPVGHGNFNAATFVGVVTLLYYFRLSWRLALGMTAIFLLPYWSVIALHAALGLKIGRPHVRTPVTHPPLVCRPLIEKNTKIHLPTPHTL